MTVIVERPRQGTTSFLYPLSHTPINDSTLSERLPASLIESVHMYSRVDSAIYATRYRELKPSVCSKLNKLEIEIAKRTSQASRDSLLASLP